MTVTYDRGEAIAYWAGDGLSAVDDQTQVHMWVDLSARPGDADVPADLATVLTRLNLAGLDWDEELQGGANARMTIPFADNLAIGVHCAGWGVAPVVYLDALCDALTAQGWQGRLRLHTEAERIWVPYGPEPTITTMFGYGLIPNRVAPFTPWGIWDDQPTVKAHLADVALDWINAADGPLTYISEMAWRPTSALARDVLQVDLGRNLPFAIELGRLIGDAPAQQGGQYAADYGRVGRTAVFERGYLTLTENDPKRQLQDRLADHYNFLIHRSQHALYGLTTGTVGHARGGPMAVHGARPGLRFEDVTQVPHQRPGHTPGLPDAYYSQIFDPRLLDGSTADTREWRVQAGPGGLTALTALDPRPWFTIQAAPSDPRPGWIMHDADPSALAEARASLGNLLQQSEAGSAN